MIDSILNTIKKMLGVPVDNTAFDADILVLLNGSIATLHQLGVGPESPVLVVDKDTEWADLTLEPEIEAMAKDFIYFRTKISFDPPSSSFVLESFKNLIQEVTWRIEVAANPYIPPVEPPAEP